MIREHCSLFAAFKNVDGWDQGGFAAKWNVTNPNWPEGGVHGGGDLQYVILLPLHSDFADPKRSKCYAKRTRSDLRVMANLNVRCSHHWEVQIQCQYEFLVHMSNDDFCSIQRYVSSSRSLLIIEADHMHHVGLDRLAIPTATVTYGRISTFHSVGQTQGMTRPPGLITLLSRDDMREVLELEKRIYSGGATTGFSRCIMFWRPDWEASTCYFLLSFVRR